MLPEVNHAWIWHNGTLPDGLRLEPRPIAPPQAGEVVVRLTAIGLNPVDWKLLNIKDNDIPGVDGAGIIVATGDGVASERLGERVVWHQSLLRAGSFAEYTTLPARVLMTLPQDLDDAHGAAFPCPGLTAWQALDKVPPREGETVLISGAGGSVGHYLTQMARQRGFRVHTLSNPRHFDRLKTLGAAETLAEPENPAEWHNDQRYYAIWDAVNADRAPWLCKRLRANGHFVAIQGRAEQWPCPPFGPSLSLHEVALGALHTWGDGHDWQNLTMDGEQLLAALARGELQTEPLVTSDFTLLNIALDRLMKRDFSGKMVVLMAPEGR